METVHILDVEAAINHWRARQPADAGAALAPEVAALAELYARMVFERQGEVEVAQLTPAARTAWLAASACARAAARSSRRAGSVATWRAACSSATRAEVCSTAARASSSCAFEMKPCSTSCWRRASSLRASAAWARACASWASVTATSSRRRPVSMFAACARALSACARASSRAARSASSSSVNSSAPRSTVWPACTARVSSRPPIGAAT